MYGHARRRGKCEGVRELPNASVESGSISRTASPDPFFRFYLESPPEKNPNEEKKNESTFLT